MDLVRNIFTGVLSDVPPDFIPVGTIIDEPDTPREDTPIKTYDSVESIATVKVDKTTLARIMPVRISIDELHDFSPKGSDRRGMGSPMERGMHESLPDRGKRQR